MSRKHLIKAYYEGVKEGLWKYAHWQDGVQYVGTMGTTLKEAVAKVELEEQKALDEIQDRKDIKSNLGYSRIGLNNV